MEAAVVIPLHFFTTGALLLTALGFMIVALVGFLGGFREVEPLGEDEPDVLQARCNPPRWPVEITVWPRRGQRRGSAATLEEKYRELRDRQSWKEAERTLEEVAGGPVRTVPRGGSLQGGATGDE